MSALNPIDVPLKGLSRLFPREYSTWNDIKTRCNNLNREDYHNYGGRGIKVCKRWKSFRNFIIDMGPRPSLKHSIDRTDNNGNYEPCNCCWRTRKEQNRNRRDNRIITHKGISKCLADWAEHYKLTTKLLWVRLKHGWSFKRAIETPPSDFAEKLTYQGRTQTIYKWAQELGINHQLVHQRRVRDGWSLHKALFTPVRRPHKG